MKKTRNFVQLVGNLGADAKVISLESGKAMISFSLATTDSWTTAAGEEKESTEWHDVIIYRKTVEAANNLSSYLTKGVKLIVQGSLSYRYSKDKNEVQHKNASIVVDDLDFLSGRKNNNDETGSVSEPV